MGELCQSRLFLFVYSLHGASKYYGLVLQVARFIIVRVSALRCRVLCSTYIHGVWHSYSRLLHLRAEESRVKRHVKPLLCDEAFIKPHALRFDATLGIDALVHGYEYLRLCYMNVQVVLVIECHPSVFELYGRD